MNPRDKREHALFVQWRKGTGRARVAINRKPTRIVSLEPAVESIDPETGRVVKTQAGPTVRVRGAGIVIMPVPLTKPMRKALLHFCTVNEIALVPCEEHREVPLGVDPSLLGPVTLTTAFQAFGRPEALRKLTEHRYVTPRLWDGVDRWYYATTARGGHDATTLTRLRVKGKNDPVGCKWTTAHNAFVKAVAAGDATEVAKNLPKIGTGKGKPE